MGNSESPIIAVQEIVTQLKEEIPEGRFFELGDDPEILDLIDKHLNSLRQSLDKLMGSFKSKSLKEINPYLAIERITGKVQEFVGGVRKSGVGSKSNTRRLFEYINELENIIAKLDHLDDEEMVAEKSTAQQVEFKPITHTSTTPIASQVSHQISTNQQVSPPPKNYLRQQSAATTKSFRVSPKAMGYFIFDIMGKKPSADSSLTIMGWLVIIAIILILLLVIFILAGPLNLTTVVDLFKEGWRFFFPAK